MRTSPQTIPDDELDKEYDLTEITVERIDLVDEPCIPKAVIRIIKNKHGFTKEGMKVAEEKDKLELTEEEQKQLEKSLSEAAKLIQDEMDKVKDEKKKKRLNMILANLKGLTKKDDDDDEEEDKDKKNKVKKDLDDLEKALKDELIVDMKDELKKELQEEIEKAGRSISRKTASDLEKIVVTIKSALSALETITKPGEPKKKPDDEYKDEYPKPKTTKKSFDLTELQKHTKKTYELYKNEKLDEDGVDKFIKGLFDVIDDIANDEEGGE